MSCYTFDGGREIFGRYVQPLGIVAHITFRSAYSSCKQSHQLLNDVGCAVSMDICGITLGMGFEDVVHHRQTETAHQSAIKLQLAVVHAFTKTMDMKRIIYLYAVLLIMATGNAQTLSERHKGLAACACLMAHGDMNRLEPATNGAIQ